MIESKWSSRRLDYSTLFERPSSRVAGPIPIINKQWVSGRWSNMGTILDSLRWILGKRGSRVLYGLGRLRAIQNCHYTVLFLATRRDDISGRHLKQVINIFLDNKMKTLLNLVAYGTVTEHKSEQNPHGTLLKKPPNL